MALSIGVKQGSKIDVGESQVAVTAILNPTLIAITVDDGEELLISDQEGTQIMPGVVVFAGVGGAGVGNRLAFEASRDIPIHRLPETPHVEETVGV